MKGLLRVTASLNTYRDVCLVCVLLFPLLLMSVTANAERIRLDRKHGVVNEALQQMLSEQIKTFPKGVGKIELGRDKDSRAACELDLFVSASTVFVVLDSRRASMHEEFYVDHPDDSFRDVLFQALVKEANQSELSVDKKTGSYKFRVRSNSLAIEVKNQGKSAECEFDLSKAVLLPGETE